MTLEKWMQTGRDIQLIRVYEPVKYNPIRPNIYPDSERSFLRDESCRSNVIGKDNDKILGISCYDAE